MPRPASHPRITLTNTAIERLLPGDEIRDDLVPGLTVRGHASGRSFMLFYTVRGRRRRPKIGDYGVLSISDARKIAKRMLAEVAAGGDPSGARQAARLEPTLAVLWDRVAAEHYRGDQGWAAEAARIWNKDIKPRLGTRRVADLDYEDVKKMHDALGSPSTANRALAVLSKMLALAERWKMRPLGSNPCQHVVRFPERKRRRYAKPEELLEIGERLRQYANANPIGVAMIYLLAFSGARPTEIERARWDQLEETADGAGVLRIEDGKTGRRDVHLPPQAMAVLAKVPRTGAAIFRRRMPRRLWETIRDQIGAGDLWLRDLRRTFATVGMSNNVNAGVVGELLGHASAQTTKIYAKLMEDPAAAAAKSIADRVAGLMGEQP